MGNFAIRSARYRFIQYHDGSRKLYDLTTDPHEWTNLATSHEYQKILAEHAAHLPTDQHPVLPGDSTGHQAYAAANANMTKKSSRGGNSGESHFGE